LSRSKIEFNDLITILKRRAQEMDIETVLYVEACGCIEFSYAHTREKDYCATHEPEVEA